MLVHHRVLLEGTSINTKHGRLTYENSIYIELGGEFSTLSNDRSVKKLRVGQKEADKRTKVCYAWAFPTYVPMTLFPILTDLYKYQFPFISLLYIFSSPPF